MADSNYQAYVERCKKENNIALNKHNHLLEYKKNKQGNRIGATLAYRGIDGKVYIGFSLYNKKKEQRCFSKDIAINKAMMKAWPIESFSIATYGNYVWDTIPASLLSDVKRMISRTIKYFK